MEPSAVVAVLALNLQRLARIDVDYHATRRIAARDAYEIVVQHRDAPVGLAAAKIAVRLLDDLVRAPLAELTWLDREVDRFRTLAATFQPDIGQLPIQRAAHARGIPLSRIDPFLRFLELGTGAFRRRIQGSVTSLTPAITNAIVQDKAVTHHYLRAAGLPVPDAAVVRTVEQALAIAAKIGYPVVVKPVDLGASFGVSLDVRDEPEVRTAFARAADRSQSGRILVERFISGDKYRTLVVGGRLLHATRRTRASVTGDGVNTIRELVARENDNPDRGLFADAPYRLITLDDQVTAHLAKQGLDLDHVPPAGQVVTLRAHPTVENGGLAFDCTAEVHPENAAMFVQAAQVVGADVVTMDVVATDITLSMRTAGGAIIELNTGSGFRLELAMAGGPGLDPGPAIVEMLFPPGVSVRAPVIAVCGDGAVGADVARAIAAIFSASGSALGLASADGVVIAGALVRTGDGCDAAGARLLLNNPATEIAVVQVDAARIVEEGLGFDYCDVAVVLGLSGLRTPDGRPIEAVLTELVAPDGILVLNADDAAVAVLARDARGEVMLVSVGSENERLLEHTAHGGRALMGSESGRGALVLVAGETRTEIGQVACETGAPLAVAAAVAAAIARGVALDTVRGVFPRPC